MHVQLLLVAYLDPFFYRDPDEQRRILTYLCVGIWSILFEEFALLLAPL
jgi:hypothetical protein